MNFDTGALGASMDWVKKLEGALGGDHPALRRGKLPLELSIYAFMPHRIAVVSVQGREAVNETYQYDVEVVTPFPPEIFQLAAFGRSAKLLLRTPDHDARAIGGTVAALEVCGVADRGLGKDLFRYVLTIVPPMWTWTQRRSNRVFQHQSVIEVVTSMLAADKIHHRFRLIDKEYPKRPLFYQRDETDYEFFKRILAEAGIYFFFEHAVQDSLTNGVIAEGGAAAGMVGATGGGLSTAGGMIGGGVGGGMGAMGGAMSSVGGSAQELTHAVTCIVLADGADGATPLQDFAALNDLANVGMKKLAGAAVGAMGVPKELSDTVEASTGFDACDAITMDDGTAAASGDERAYAFSFRRSLRPKSAWTLERDSTVPESWAHRERIDAFSVSKLSLDFHMSLGRNGVGVTGGASLKMDVEAPEIPAATLEQELISRNAGWLRYPSERNPKESGEGSFKNKHPHLKRPLEQLRRDLAIAIAETDCRRLGAGYRFTLSQASSRRAQRGLHGHGDEHRRVRRRHARPRSERSSPRSAVRREARVRAERHGAEASATREEEARHGARDGGAVGRVDGHGEPRARGSARALALGHGPQGPRPEVPDVEQAVAPRQRAAHPRNAAVGGKGLRAAGDSA